ncbi:MAG: LysR family transcriptional regulator [Paracoccaceae bacterium]
MPSPTPRRGLSLQWLELFKICADKGALQAAAEETGLSVSTVSHHLSNLEECLGVALFDHSRRPMLLTPTGHAFLRRIEGVLHELRAAQAEASAGNPENARYLRVGLVDDLDSDVAPGLAVFAAKRMPQCDFFYHTDSSHAIMRMLRNRELDIGVVAHSPDQIVDLLDYPFLRDPFLVVTPMDMSGNLNALLRGETGLPFIRFARNLFIGRQIEAQLRRLNITLPNRFECVSSNTQLAMVAAGSGWTITTALHFSRGQRFHDKVALHRFPSKSFARTMSVAATPDCSQAVLTLFRSKIVELLTETTLPAIYARLPWLKDSFTLID